MMMNEDLFRFISLRPPAYTKQADEDFIAETAVATRLSNRIKAESKRSNKSTAETKLLLGNEITGARDYYTRHLRWAQLLGKPSQAKEILALCQKVPLDLNHFKDAVDSLLRVFLSLQTRKPIHLSKASRKKLLHTLIPILWQSFYGAVMAERNTGQELEDLSEWLRLVHMIALIDKPATFQKVAPKIHTMRPAVPKSLISRSSEGTTKPATTVPGGLIDSHANTAKNLAVQVQNLTKVSSWLQQMYSRHIQSQAARALADARNSRSFAVRIAPSRPNHRVSVRPLTQYPTRLSASPKDLSKTKSQTIVRHLATLEALGIDTASIATPDVITRVERRIAELRADIDALRNEDAIINVDNVSVRIRRARIKNNQQLNELISVEAKIRPIGIGDLKVVKQRIAKYLTGEIAHIENVMAKEKRHREHRRLRQFEEVVAQRSEREEESKRDLQTTDRFELQNESQKTLRSETGIQAGLDVSAQYGPVAVSAFGRFSTTNTQEQIDNASIKYAKEVIDRAVNRLMEKKSEERQAKTLEEFEEKNSHGFENSGDSHVTGTYKWVDKYYRARVINYGKRLMFEFFVPEPAAFFTFARTYNEQHKILPEKPAPPTRPLDINSITLGGATAVKSQPPLSPSDIERNNYLSLVQQYKVSSIEPPPPVFIAISKAIGRELRESNHFSFADEELKIPKGYVAQLGQCNIATSGTTSPFGNILVGRHFIDINSGQYPIPFLHSESDFVPISGTISGAAAVAINIEVVCGPTIATYEKWQIDTYNAIMAAYNKSLMDYDEKVAAAKIQKGVQLGGTNPQINRAVEIEELKKACMTMWCGFNFSHMPGIKEGNINAQHPANEYPEIVRENAQRTSERIRLFEEGFEWPNAVYEFYPYYWARKDKWVDILSLQDPDPVFEKFLRAGAARVLVPVRPSATEQILHYQLTGIIGPHDGYLPMAWAKPDDEEGELYNSYIKEMAGVPDLPDVDKDVEILAKDPSTWLIKVPTSLVTLQDNSELPDYEKS
jgi:hypothetical protein